MSELRQDMVSKEWVIIATERARRPHEFAREAPPRSAEPHRADCPFCRGNEERTPASLLAVPDDGSWRVRVVPNKFAALSPEAAWYHGRQGKFLHVGGFGSAEVVVETPRHDLSPAQLPVDQVRHVLAAYRARYRSLMEDPRHHLITIFRNHGARAGTSLEHGHSQIIATPVMPTNVRNQIDQSVRSFDTYGTCLFCVVIEEERAAGTRVVAETPHFIAFCPYASRSPFELRLFPKRHHCFFGGVQDGELDDLAGLLRTLLGKVHRGLGDPDYNLVIRSHSLESRENRHYHWHMVIVPRLTTPAGFEMGTGIYINTAAPEESAAFLRDVEPAEIAG